MKTVIINDKTHIKLEQVTFGDKQVWVGDAYDNDGNNITDTDWSWDREEQAIHEIKQLVSYGQRFYTPT